MLLLKYLMGNNLKPVHTNYICKCNPHVTEHTLPLHNKDEPLTPHICTFFNRVCIMQAKYGLFKF